MSAPPIARRYKVLLASGAGLSHAQALAEAAGGYVASHSIHDTGEVAVMVLPDETDADYFESVLEEDDKTDMYQVLA